MHSDRVRLGQFPSRSYVYDCLHDILAVVVYEAEGTELVADCDCELIIVHKADLFDLGGIVDVVEQDLVANHAGFFC